MIKDLEQRSVMKGHDIAESFAQWFDELYLGKYDVIEPKNGRCNLD